MGLSGVLLLNQQGRKLWLYAIHTLLFNFEAIYKLRNLSDRRPLVPEIPLQSNGKAFTQFENYVPLMDYRDNPFPVVKHLLSFDRNYLSDKAWLNYLSVPIFELDLLDETTVRDFFNLHCDKINQTLRRHWIRVPGGMNATYENWKNSEIKQAGTQRMRNVLFNAARYLPPAFVNFPLLTTFLVVNEVTGSVHLFSIKNLPDDQKPEMKFYARF
jgi:hypothetical protein